MSKIATPTAYLLEGERHALFQILYMQYVCNKRASFPPLHRHGMFGVMHKTIQYLNQRMKCIFLMCHRPQKCVHAIHLGNHVHTEPMVMNNTDGLLAPVVCGVTIE